MAKLETVWLDVEKCVDEWEQLVSASPQGSVFCRKWWMEAVQPGGYGLLGVRRGDGKLVAGQVVPFNSDRSRMSMPRLTQTLGPLLTLSDKTRYGDKLTFEMDLLAELADALSKLTLASFNAKYTLTNWLPYMWKGYKQTTKYTYVIPDISDLAQVHENLTVKLKGKIEKAKKICHVEEIDDIADFYEINKKTFARQGMSIPYPLEFVRRLDDAAKAHQARLCLVAKDGEGRAHVAIYVVYDEKSAYLLMSGGDPELRKSEAKTLLVWEAIQRLSGKTKAFDFEGSCMQNIESWDREFSAIQMPYLAITKDSRSPLRHAWEYLKYRMG